VVQATRSEGKITMSFHFAAVLSSRVQWLFGACHAATNRRNTWCGLALIGVSIAGCSDEQWAAVIKDPAFSVKGKVLLPGGQPLTAGRIEFVPSKEPGRLAYGAIAADGTFTLQTRQPGDGAIPGDYKIRIMIPEKREFSRLARYRDEDSSRLTATVRAEPNNLEAFRLR
jgi:hypothetical protein